MAPRLSSVFMPVGATQRRAASSLNRRSLCLERPLPTPCLADPSCFTQDSCFPPTPAPRKPLTPPLSEPMSSPGSARPRMSHCPSCQLRLVQPCSSAPAQGRTRSRRQGTVVELSQCPECPLPPLRYWKLDPAQVYASGPNAWDTGVHDASEEYKHRMVGGPPLGAGSRVGGPPRRGPA